MFCAFCGLYRPILRLREEAPALPARMCTACATAFLSAMIDSRFKLTLEPDGHVDCQSAFVYDQFIRGQVLAAKIRGTLPAVQWLCSAFTTKFRDLSLRQGQDGVMPVPSSLWSRLRLRCDLAGHLAASLAGSTGLLVIQPPFHFGWQLHKQAHRSRRERSSQVGSSQLLLQRWLCLYKKQLEDLDRIILVDDVLTTGSSMAGLATEIRRHFPGLNLIGLVLAKSSTSSPLSSLDSA